MLLNKIARALLSPPPTIDSEFECSGSTGEVGENFKMGKILKFDHICHYLNASVSSTSLNCRNPCLL